MKLNSIKSVALTALLVACAAAATFSDTSDSDAQPAANPANATCPRSAQAWEQNSAYPMTEVAVGASMHSVSELFAVKASPGTRQELVTKVAAIYLNMDSNEVPASVLEASAIVDAWLAETDLTKSNSFAAPTDSILVIDGYLGALASCQ